ncbi:hypothetical protein DAPPUDRAFT_302231 [Daphnia pulex]|uniref:Uncharacterized protein n=1 Tax=Daphnia pulex TaxID=6669 RepID=E9HML4_DAPPU|nr:hypothetical protein DAPPUDRAFT_302231 [Daphnia pulex]|eukprot:EFX66987.1 hypothetical protein DAPPUDRAFT_302231 [Daphnia pulex]
MFSDVIKKNQYTEKLNPSAENARSEENNNRKKSKWIPIKIFFSRHKRAPSSTSAVREKTEPENLEPIVDEEVLPSCNVHREMSRDTTPIESKCRTSTSSLRRKKRPAPQPFRRESSSSSFTALLIMDLRRRDTIELETVVTITTITTATNEGNEVDQLPLVDSSDNSHDEKS